LVQVGIRFTIILSILVSGKGLANEGLHSKRPAEQIANYSLFGISLKTKPDDAVRILEEQGFILASSNLQPGLSSWEFRKDKVFIRIEESRSSDWNGLGKIFVRENYADKWFDVAERAEKITQSWAENEDGKPVCFTSKGYRGDRVVQGACSVTDPAEDKFVFVATLNVMQIDMHLALKSQVL